MKTLILVRHAKAVPVGSPLADRDRPLNDRGKQDARMMGKRLAQRDLMPDLLVSSPALRALTTAQSFADELGAERKSIVVEERLYASSADTLLEVVRTLDGGFERVMLFGHNPEFGDLARRLSGSSVEMPTCTIAEFSFDTAVWSAIGDIEPTEVVLDSPKK